MMVAPRCVKLQPSQQRGAASRPDHREDVRTLPLGELLHHFEFARG
jgi:hypothetical protein